VVHEASLPKLQILTHIFNTLVIQEASLPKLQILTHIFNTLDFSDTRSKLA